MKKFSNRDDSQRNTMVKYINRVIDDGKHYQEK